MVGSDDGLLEVAVRAADLVCEVFGEDGIASVCGHPEIETGLVELARVTGCRRYIEQAKLFVDRRGTGVLRPIEFGQAYFQDDQPVREATVLRGHAVRANYLSAGAADVAAETGDEELLGALATQWDNTVARRTYITGGQGAHHQDEAFGADFELPSDRACSEACAGVASVQFSWRLLVARGGAHYADLIERTLYNVVATSPSPDGTAFYYANTLQQRAPGEPADPDTPSARAESSLRAPWFDVSCCPPNVARTFASLASYLATTDGAGVQLHQYAPATVRTPLDGRAFADFAVATEYPVDGAIVVTIGEGSSGEWTLALRVPAWAEGSTAELCTARGAEPLKVAPGYLEVRREFRAGDTVTLYLPLAPRLTHPDPRIDAIRGTVAVERGPEVLALESVDLGSDVADAEILTDEPLREEDGRVTAAISLRRRRDAGWPYGAAAPDDAAPETLRVPLVAYHEWAERRPSTMRIWVPEAR